MFTLLLIIVYVAGILSACHSTMQAKSASASIGWFSALTFVPIIALPLYWTFGNVRYKGYQKYSEAFDAARNSKEERPAAANVQQHRVNPLEAIAGNSFKQHNSLKLLIDGQQTYDTLFDALDAAKIYILLQFYTIEPDQVGQQLKQHLLNAAARGVKVYFMYDEIGSINLPNEYLDELTAADITISRFSGRGRWFKRFKLNFRNHRKIVVIDGTEGFIGGLNIGKAYLGQNTAIGPWRDTHTGVAGPVVDDLAESFKRDWYYGTHDLLEFDPVNDQQPGEMSALLATTGPHDSLKNSSLLFTHCINSSTERVWIATPYFVPDETILSALKLAALRGVDVRIVIPGKSDMPLMKYTVYFYFDELIEAGVKFYRHSPGFMHQKVMLVDQTTALIGTANMDNRSLHLNFEAILVVLAKAYAQEVAQMLEQDFSDSDQFADNELQKKSLRYRFTVRLIRLFAPIL